MGHLLQSKLARTGDIANIHGVFKKRRDFLNSAPTGTGSALRLRSAPSGRLWQQTAICLVSLWPLVAELHPPKWARAQAVRRISDKVTMKEPEEQRVCVKFCCKLGKNFTETFQLLNQAYGDHRKIRRLSRQRNKHPNFKPACSYRFVCHRRVLIVWRRGKTFRHVKQIHASFLWPAN